MASPSDRSSNVPDLRRRLGISQQTHDRWRTKYGGMNPKMAKQLQELQKENSRLRKLVADQDVPRASPPDG
jgi:putative transposase